MSVNDDSDDGIDPNEPTTLAEMQAMDAADFRAVDRYLYRGSLSKKRVIRHLIELAADELSWQGRQDANSLRDFWYNPTKAILEAAFPNWGDGPGSSDWNREMSKRLSGVMSELVQDPENPITYRSLNILDDSRDRRIATEDLENDKILFVEKSAAYRKLEPLAEVYDITLVEGSGWSATALIEDLAQQLDPDQEFTFWVLGDYDPTGFGIVEDFVQRAAKLGINVNQSASRRIGIRPDQVDDDIVEAQKFTPSANGNSDDWFDQYAIDGKFGLEIEAIGSDLEGKADALRELVVDEIRDEIDEDGRRFRDTQQSAANVPGHATSRVVRDLTDDLEDALLDVACSIFAEQDGVLKAEPLDFMTGASVTLDRDAVFDGGTGDMVPEPYPEGRLHSGAVSGNEPNAQGGRKGKNRLKSELRERIRDGDIDVEALLDL